MNNDCRYGNVVGSAVCTREKTASYLKLTIKSNSPSITNPLPKQTYTYIYIYNVIPPRSTSNKHIYPCYFTLFKTDSPGATEYYDTHVVTVVPKYNGLTNVRMEQHNDRYDKDFTYPGFLRVESIMPSELNFTIQENEKRVIVLASRFGFKGMGTITNQQSYPCTSNINVACTFLLGHADTGSLEQIL